MNMNMKVMYSVAAIILIIILLSVIFRAFYFSVWKPIQHRRRRHRNHHDDQSQNQSKHKALKRCVADIHLKTVFKTFDKNNDEFITKQEMMESMEDIGIPMTEREVDTMIRRVDANGDGKIDIDEFCGSFNNPLMATKAETFKEIFDVFDEDEDGYITVSELGSVLTALGFEEGQKTEDCKDIIDQFDLDGDGAINFLEFKKMMIKLGHKLFPVDL